MQTFPKHRGFSTKNFERFLESPFSESLAKKKKTFKNTTNDFHIQTTTRKRFRNSCDNNGNKIHNFIFKFNQS